MTIFYTKLQLKATAKRLKRLFLDCYGEAKIKDTVKS